MPKLNINSKNSFESRYNYIKTLIEPNKGRPESINKKMDYQAFIDFLLVP